MLEPPAPEVVGECLDEIERLRVLIKDPHCFHTETGRGDCEHAVGLPGEDQNVDHDGPRTEDVYGKPNGWCWYCWLSYQNSTLRTRVWKLEMYERRVADLDKFIEISHLEHDIAMWDEPHAKICTQEAKIEKLDSAATTWKAKELIWEEIRSNLRNRIEELERDLSARDSEG
jgi:hypothetical protein